MEIGIPSIIWSLLYITLGLWVALRIFAVILQYVIRRQTGILVKIDRVGLGAFHKILISINEGLKVEIDKVWLSSCYLNEGIRQPVVLRMGEVRIQANTDGRKEKAPSNPTERQQGSAVSKFAVYLQHFGLKVESLRVMLLKTMVADCLIHLEGQELGLDISYIENSLQFILNAGSVNCRVLRSVEKGEQPGRSAQPCLAEMSFSLYVDLSVYRNDLKRVKGSRVLVDKPQIMLTEALLSGNHFYGDAEQGPSLQENTPTADRSRFLQSLPQELGIDVSNVDVKVVRETKQRSLNVKIKTFHVDMFNQYYETESQEVTCTLLIEDFSTKSEQARFAELVKLELKTMLSEEEIRIRNRTQGAYFHYHHDEFQYWALVISKFVENRKKAVSNIETTVLNNDQSSMNTPYPQLQRKIEVNIELLDSSTAFSTAACPGLVLGVSKVLKYLVIKPGLLVHGNGMLPWLQSHDLVYELEVDTLYCTHADSQIPLADFCGKKHYWNHVFYSSILMLKVNKFGPEIRLNGMQDHLHVEWSTSTVGIIIALVTALSKAKISGPRKLSNAAFKPVKNMKIPAQEGIHINMIPLVKFDVTNTNLFVCNNYNVGLMLRIDSGSLEYKQHRITTTVEGSKLQYITVKDKFKNVLRSCDIDHPAASFKEIRIRYKVSEKEFIIQLAKEVLVDWTTSSHMCIIQAVEDVTEFKHKLKGEEVAFQNIPVRRVSNDHNTETSVSVMITTSISLNLHLSSQHRLTKALVSLLTVDHVLSVYITDKGVFYTTCLMGNNRFTAHSITLCSDKILMSMTPEEVVTEIDSISIYCDQEKIFQVENLLCGSMPGVQLMPERKSFISLTLETNKAWNISIDMLTVNFPYKFNFAACFDEFVNFQKWLKLVHKVKKKPFTVDSKLPPDLQIKLKMFILALCDDPFEVKLGDNYELMKDEYNESEKRSHVLHQKVQNLKKTVGIIPAHKLEEVYSTLAKSNSDIYIQRSRQLYQITPLRTKLFTWNMENLGIIALADTSIHGKENVVKTMQEIDPESPYPEEGLEFSTLWCRYVRFEVGSWTFQLRDYPQLALNIVDMHIWGRLLGSEIEGAKRAKRQCTVEVDSPWGNMEVERNLPTLKFFHDLSCDVDVFEMAHGACWEPAVAMFNLGLDLISKPSVDPSKPLPWWDKIRLLLHGRLTMTTTKMRWLYHASLDPYNSTELMDWTWTDLVLDWTNAKFILKGNLDVYARTASKYDDCKLLSMPNLKFCAKIQWLCLGDPNDHHHVMPCAPDKVPDYSHDSHDSFRAFRSQNFTLSISLETYSSKSKDSSTKHPRYPNGLFYASTLRFLDRIKTCLIGSVTRPIKRGPLFKNFKPRKTQMSRHYKYAELSVNFHQFEVSYWMSFSLQHGAKFSGKSFVLELKNELELKPVDDGLLHRPRADWKVIHLCSELSDTKIWLCSSNSENEEELNVSVAGRPITDSFFLSVSKVTYQRYSALMNGDLEETPPSPNTETKTPIHNVQVYEMRGSWNKDNRKILIGLSDGYQKAQSLKRNLSAEALKGFKVEGGGIQNSRINLKGLNLTAESDTAATPSPSSKMQTGHALSMLMKLVAESDSKSVAFTEEPSSANMDQLQGIAACQKDDIIQKKWHIELHNSQIILKGCETPGFVIVAAAKAEILSSAHVPVWVDGQLKSKDSWIGSLECMQYYATVESKHDFTDDSIPWLSRQHVEDRSEPGLSSLQEMTGSGHSVGGIVNTSYHTADKKSKSIQLQRIISRCKCQFFYANYGEVDPNQLQEVPQPPGEDSDMMTKEEGVDTFTLLHHDLNVCSNNLQYIMILDIVNNLLLHVELKKKEATEKLQRMRFQLQLSRVEDQKTPILSLQENVRQQMEKSRQYEKELFLVIKALEEEGVHFEQDEENSEDDTGYTTELIQERDMLEAELRQCKDKIIALNEELTIRISCFKESQLQGQAQLQQTKQTQQAHVIRRNEVCFKFAQWRLTEMDGQVGIVDLALRNFVYTKVNRDNETWTHLVELGWVKMTNLLPNAIYKDILVPRDLPGQDDNRKMTLRVLCTERPPVGGIAVKEHFEVNVVPLQIQMTYQFFKKMMEFFFPDKNIETDDQDEDMDGAAASKPPKSEKKGQQKKEIKRSPSFPATDDIDKMKERAANNKTFLYIKIPQVSLRVSYKGEKDKNIEDVHDFSLVLPTLEYHNCIWTWFDLLMTMKSDTKRVLISQALKQKLHLRNRIGEETPLTDVQQEEDKAKMLLGAKLLAPQEKPVKKTLFGKSTK